jgi:hypothetical protein
MSIELMNYYDQKEFKPGQLANAFRKVIEFMHANADGFEIWSTYDYGRHNEKKFITIADLVAITKIHKMPGIISFWFDPHSSNKKFRDNGDVTLYEWRNYLILSITMARGECMQEIVEIIKNDLNLHEAPSELVGKTQKNKTRMAPEFLTCFLSYRFNKYSRQIALEVTRFVELLDIRVISGAGYEPKRIEDKVQQRLNQNIDLLIYLITKDGESTWTRDELTYAYARGAAIVILVEEGAQMATGLLGNIEYLPFASGHVSDTYVGILEAMRYVKSEKEENTITQDDKKA